MNYIINLMSLKVNSSLAKAPDEILILADTQIAIL